MAEKRSLLSRVGQGLVSFGSGIPSSQIDAIRANRDIAEDQAELTGIQLEREKQRPELEEAERRRKAQLELEMQSLRREAADGNPQAVRELFAREPENAKKALETVGLVNEGRQGEAKSFVAAYTSAQGNPQLQEQIVRRRVSFVAGRQNDPGNPIDTASLLEMEPAQRDAAVAAIGAALEVGAGDVPAEQQSFEALIDGFSPEDQEKARRVKAGLDPRAGGLSSIERIAGDPGTTDSVADSQAQIRGATKSAEVNASERAQRTQGIINQGREVADTAPTLKRAIELLDAVSTGGVINEAQLAFAQRFGIETADQGELSSTLGKAVLSQLRETFGAQFTQQEGERLASIEAGFSKNNETNKRLLNQALEIVEFKAKRAAKLARDSDDPVTAQLIEDAMLLDLSPNTAEIAASMSDDDLRKQLGL